MKNQILEGDALTVLKTLPSESIDCIITSPPYWALRDYKVDGQIGNEKTIDEYITKLINIFNECKRILKREGTCWVVLGDTYSGSGGAGGDYNEGGLKEGQPKYRQHKIDISTKSLCLIPERFSLKMIENKWVLRNKIIWYKPNCMPSSAKDRFTVDYENVYFFIKSQKYYFKTQYEPLLTEPHKPGNKKEYDENFTRHFSYKSLDKVWANPQGRIKRCVWKIATKPFKEAHFAVFPEELVQQCMNAGCPSEICKKCGKSPTPNYNITKINTRSGTSPKLDCKCRQEKEKGNPYGTEFIKADYIKYRQQIIRTQNGIDKCNCNAGFDSGIVLDPFMGSGTVALVALKNAMNFVGIELNPDYITMAQKRIEPYLKQEKITQFTVK